MENLRPQNLTPDNTLNPICGLHMWASASPEVVQGKPLEGGKKILECIYFYIYVYIYFSSVQSLSCVQLFVTPWIGDARPPCPSPTPGLYSNSCPLSRWCHSAISSSIVPFSSCPQSFLESSESFPVSQFFASAGQSIGVSASVLPMNIQAWFPLGWTGLICLQSKGLSRIFSNTTVQKLQFFSSQLSSCSNSHIHRWLLEKP